MNAVAVTISLTFEERLRGEKKFKGIDELKAQLPEVDKVRRRRGVAGVPETTEELQRKIDEAALLPYCKIDNSRNSTNARWCIDNDGNIIKPLNAEGLHLDQWQYLKTCTGIVLDKGRPFGFDDMNVFNLWKGFALEPVKGDWLELRGQIESDILDHLSRDSVYAKNIAVSKKRLAAADYVHDSEDKLKQIIADNESRVKEAVGEYFNEAMAFIWLVLNDFGWRGVFCIDDNGTYQLFMMMRRILGDHFATYESKRTNMSKSVGLGKRVIHFQAGGSTFKQHKDYDSGGMNSAIVNEHYNKFMELKHTGTRGLELVTNHRCVIMTDVDNLSLVEHDVSDSTVRAFFCSVMEMERPKFIIPGLLL